MRCRNKFRGGESRIHKECNKIGIIWVSTESIQYLMILNNNSINIKLISLFHLNIYLTLSDIYLNHYNSYSLIIFAAISSSFSAMPSMLLCSVRIALHSWNVCISHLDTCLISIFCYHSKMMTMIFVIFGTMRNRVNLSNYYSQYEASITPQNVINSIISKNSLIGLILLSICLCLKASGSVLLFIVILFCSILHSLSCCSLFCLSIPSAYLFHSILLSMSHLITLLIFCASRFLELTCFDIISISILQLLFTMPRILLF